MRDLSEFSYLVPRAGSEAEYTFYPNSKFKKDRGSDAEDVGFFLRDNEILCLRATGKRSVGRGLVKILIQEGTVSIHSEQWLELSARRANELLANESAELHGIDQITREYLSE